MSQRNKIDGMVQNPNHEILVILLIEIIVIISTYWFSIIIRKYLIEYLFQIPEMLLFGDLHRVRVEIGIITLPSNGCIYFHPRFKFYVRQNVGEPIICNPLYIDLGYDNEY